MELKPLEVQMDVRREQLLLTYSALKQKITEIDFKILQLQQTEGTNETTIKS